jgi:hypothetical protein
MSAAHVNSTGTDAAEWLGLARIASNNGEYDLSPGSGWPWIWRDWGEAEHLLQRQSRATTKTAKVNERLACFDQRSLQQPQQLGYGWPIVIRIATARCTWPWSTIDLKVGKQAETTLTRRAITQGHRTATGAPGVHLSTQCPYRMPAMLGLQGTGTP